MLLFSHSLMSGFLQTHGHVAHQALLSVGFLRQDHWSGFPFPSPGNLPDRHVELAGPALAGGFFIIKPPGKPKKHKYEKAMAPHSSTLAWKIPWMEESGGLQSSPWGR